MYRMCKIQHIRRPHANKAISIIKQFIESSFFLLNIIYNNKVNFQETSIILFYWRKEVLLFCYKIIIWSKNSIRDNWATAKSHQLINQKLFNKYKLAFDLANFRKTKQANKLFPKIILSSTKLAKLTEITGF